MIDQAPPPVGGGAHDRQDPPVRLDLVNDTEPVCGCVRHREMFSPAGRDLTHNRENNDNKGCAY